MRYAVVLQQKGVEGGPQIPLLVKWGDATWDHLAALMRWGSNDTTGKRCLHGRQSSLATHSLGGITHVLDIQTGISLVGGYELSAKPLEKKPFWSHKVGHSSHLFLLTFQTNIVNDVNGYAYGQTN
jgi:hypothetical protein